MKKILGFTLAEVLITLLITGIVASLVIPTVINDTQKQEWVTGLQKSLSDFNQAYKMWQIDIGTTDFKNNLPATADDFLNKFVKYLDVIKICHPNEKPDECFYENIKYINGSPITIPGLDVNTRPRAVLKNGNSILTYGFVPDCTWSINKTKGVPDGCNSIFVDVNGLKGPNLLGRDIFVLVFTRKNGILPSGIQGSDNYNACSGNGEYYDMGCAGKIAREGWKMNY